MAGADLVLAVRHDEQQREIDGPPAEHGDEVDRGDVRPVRPRPRAAPARSTGCRRQGRRAGRPVGGRFDAERRRGVDEGTRARGVPRASQRPKTASTPASTPLLKCSTRRSCRSGLTADEDDTAVSTGGVGEGPVRRSSSASRSSNCPTAAVVTPSPSVGIDLLWRSVPSPVWIRKRTEGRLIGQGYSSSRGRPSTRSAMMLRCTSAVPPPIVSARENRKPVCHSRRSRSCADAASEHRRRADEVAGELHDLLAVPIAEQLADARFGSRCLTGEVCRRRSLPSQLQHGVLGERRGGTLSHHRR